MGLIDALILGILQGFTEFLPVSSSGHLVLGEALLGIESEGIVFEVAVHLATAGAVVLAYRKRILAMLKALCLVVRPAQWKSGPLDEAGAARRENFLLDLYLVLGTLPAVAAGLLFKDKVEAVFDSPPLVCLMLLVTGIILVSSRFSSDKARRRLNWRMALLIGMAQAVALFPGISRSGATITMALLLGLGPGRAAEFSFLLALPVIIGASVFEFIAQITSATSSLAGFGALALGASTAFFSGFTAIFFLLKVLQKGKFDRFAYYCWALGLAGLVYFLILDFRFENI